MNRDYHLIKLAERNLWSQDIQDRTIDVWAIYALDRSSVTRLCEITPSYCLMYLGVDFRPINGLTDEQHEELHCDMDEGALSTDPVTYMHVRGVEDLITKYPDQVRKAEVSLDDQYDTDDERWNAEFDYLQEGWSTGALSF